MFLDGDEKLNPREFKDFVYEQFARIGKTLSSPKRIELLDLLAQGPKSVERLAKETKMSVANTSQHLQNTYAKSLYLYFEAIDCEITQIDLYGSNHHVYSIDVVKLNNRNGITSFHDNDIHNVTVFEPLPGHGSSYDRMLDVGCMFRHLRLNL